jgi:hypothetical protein
MDFVISLILCIGRFTYGPNYISIFWNSQRILKKVDIQYDASSITACVCVCVCAFH